MGPELIWEFFFFTLWDFFLDFVPVSICIVFSRFSSGIYYILVLWALILHGFWHVGVTKLSFVAWHSLQNLVIFHGIWYFFGGSGRSGSHFARFLACFG